MEFKSNVDLCSMSEWIVAPTYSLLFLILYSAKLKIILLEIFQLYLLASFVVLEKFGICLQVPFLFGVTAFEKAANFVIHLIFRRTGRHLFLNDNDEGRPALLRRMAEDEDESYFMYACSFYLFVILFCSYEQQSFGMPSFVGFHLYD